MEIEYREVLAWLKSLDPDTVVQDRKHFNTSEACVVTTYAKTVNPRVTATAFGMIYEDDRSDVKGYTDDITKSMMDIFDDSPKVLTAREALEILERHNIYTHRRYDGD